MLQHLLSTTLSCAALAAVEGGARPNVVVYITDDQSWLHAGCYGDPAVRTPNLDRLAAGGVRFTHAFTSAPSCAPSRAALLTGQAFFRLAEAANLIGTFPDQFSRYPTLLAQNGYRVGSTGKGWAPGYVPGDKSQANPAGPAAKNLLQEARASGKPFVLWCGDHNPHRPYRPKQGIEHGIDPQQVAVPPFLPDDPAVRSDLADYLWAIQEADRKVGDLIKQLEQQGQFDQTLFIFTSDNGMPFPRGKCNLYDAGTRMPCIIAWPGRIPGGRVVDDFISLTDLAPTILEAAGVAIPAEMSGRSLMPLLLSEAQGRIDPARDHVITGRERHNPEWRATPGWGYGSRALRTAEFLYIRNAFPDRLPAGPGQGHPSGYPQDSDPSPSRSVLFQCAQDPTERLADLYAASYGPRPAEELYELATDPWQMRNRIGDPQLAAAAAGLRTRLQAELTRLGDPRAADPQTPVFDQYPWYDAKGKRIDPPPAGRP